MRVRTELWGLSLMSALGFLPVACGGSTRHDDADSAGKAGATGSGGLVSADGGTAGTIDYGSGGVVWGTGGGTVTGKGGVGGAFVCEFPTFDPASGITKCQDGPWYRTQVGLGCEYVAPEWASGGQGNGGEGGAAGAVGVTEPCTPEQCTEAPRGYCTSEWWEGATHCAYGCLTDADCGSGQLCLCGDPSYGGECVTAGCVSDTECGPGFHCAMTALACGPVQFHCEAAADECQSWQDCENGVCEWAGDHRACSTAVCGRPFLVGERQRVAGLVTSAEWRDSARTPPCLDELSVTERRLLADHYARLGQMEHASIAAFARFQLQLLGLGAPVELVSACNRALADETAHARLCFELASRYAGSDVGPDRLALGDCLPAFDLESVLRLVIAEGCVGETVAALEAAEAAECATDRAVRAALLGIAADELRHAELAWRFVRWALEQGGQALQDVARATFAELLSVPEDGGTASLLPNARLAAHGLLSQAEQLEVRSGALRDVVAPCARRLLATLELAA